MDRREAYPAFLLDYASGALDDAQMLIAETHVRLSPEARTSVSLLEALGGALLETGANEAGDGASVLNRRRTSGAAIAAARDIVAIAAERPDDLRWRWRAPALRELRLPVAGAALVRMSAGRSVPEHSHTDDELTLVLRGALTDGARDYGPGEIAFADGDVSHAPAAKGDIDCVCLTAFGGRWLFRSLAARLVSRLAG
jgi:putative transcriptional regulator